MSTRSGVTESVIGVMKRMVGVVVGITVLGSIAVAMNWQRLHPPKVAEAKRTPTTSGEVEGVITTSGRLPSGHQAFVQGTATEDLQSSTDETIPLVLANAITHTHNDNDVVVVVPVPQLPEITQPDPPAEVPVVPDPVVPTPVDPTPPTPPAPVDPTPPIPPAPDPTPPTVPAITITGVHSDPTTVALKPGTTTSFTLATSDGSSVNWAPFYKNIIWSTGTNDSPTAPYWTVVPFAATPGSFVGSQITFQIQVAATAAPSANEETAFVVTDTTRNLTLAATVKFSIVAP